MDDQNQKFQPPPSNIFIRTMEDDVNALKESGGQIPTMPGEPVEVPKTFATPPPAPNPPASFEVNANQNFNQPVSGPAPTSEPFNEPSNAPEAPIFQPEINAPLNEYPPQTEAPQPKKIPKKLILIIVITLIVLGLAALGYFVVYPKLFAIKSVPPPQPDHYTCDSNFQCVTNPKGTYATLADCQANCKQVVIPPPTPVAPLASIQLPYTAYNLLLNLTGSPVILNGIKVEANKSASVDTFKIIIPKVRTEYLTIQEIAGTFIPKLPQELKSVLKTKYLVFAYYGETRTSLGLALEIGSENKDSLKSYFLNWEKKTLTKDLANFFLTATGKAKTTAFKSRNYLGAEIRYLAYTAPQTELTYAFLNDYLIITASKEAMNSAISHLQGGGSPPVAQ